MHLDKLKTCRKCDSQKFVPSVLAVAFVPVLFSLIAMGFDKAALTFKALLVVQEAVHGAGKGPAKISIGLRFALAYLYASADKPNVDQFRRFAVCIANPMTSQTEYMGNYMRGMEARGHLSSFMTMAGIAPNTDNQSKLRKAFDELAETPTPNAPDGTPRIP